VTRCNPIALASFPLVHEAHACHAQQQLRNFCVSGAEHELPLLQHLPASISLGGLWALFTAGLIVLSLAAMRWITIPRVSRSGEAQADSVLQPRSYSTPLLMIILFTVGLTCCLEILETAFFPHLQSLLSLLSSAVIVVTFSVCVCRKEKGLRAEVEVHEQRYKMLFERSLTGAYRSTLEGRILDCNVSFCHMLGYTSREQVTTGSAHLGYFSDADRADFMEMLQTKKRLTNFEQCLHRSDGSAISVLHNAELVEDRGPDRLVVRGTLTDITDLRNAEQENRRLAAIVRCSNDAILSVTLKGEIESWNAGAERVFGYHAEEMIGKSIALLSPPDCSDAYHTHMEKVRLGQKYNIETVLVGKEGRQIAIALSVSPITNRAGNVVGAAAIARDITDRKASEEQIELLAFYDALTGLPNRRLFKDRLETALAGAERRNERAALLFLDLDRFKIVNDSLGHSVGDLMLKDVGDRLKDCVRAQDTVARIGGDEFVILLTGVKNSADVAKTAARVLHAMTQRFAIEDYSLGTSCSLGISLFPDDSRDGETLIKYADQAMYCAKENGRNNFRFFTASLNKEAMQRLSLENELRLALQRQEFYLDYQPQMDMSSGDITGVEALIRWRHPVSGLVPPGDFIRVAENSGLILPIGEWVLKTACSQVSKWQASGCRPVPVAVNVSAVQFRQDGFCELIEKVLIETGIEPRYLELEVTESLLLSNADVMCSVLQRLKEMGVKLAIDDFGTGYSSLSYLKQFRVDRLKIDRSFVQDVATDSDNAVITTAIINMAKSLNLAVIAEGVEDEAQVSFLRDHGCDEIQGYYFSKPLSAGEIAVKLQLPLEKVG
jgi:diguanylate cyclase (GGDEF)-like protein/PAS domain S-box-containing protein